MKNGFKKNTPDFKHINRLITVDEFTSFRSFSTFLIKKALLPLFRYNIKVIRGARIIYFCLVQGKWFIL